MRWDEFENAYPELAMLARERFGKDELVLVGSIRADGSPRISPVEPDFAAGRLFISMMWQSRKALDLLRDPRAVVHSVPSNRMNAGGDIKLYGRIVDEQDPRVRERFPRRNQGKDRLGARRAELPLPLVRRSRGRVRPFRRRSGDAVMGRPARTQDAAEPRLALTFLRGAYARIRCFSPASSNRTVASASLPRPFTVTATRAPATEA